MVNNIFGQLRQNNLHSYTLLFILWLFIIHGCNDSEVNPDPNTPVRYFSTSYQYPTGGVSFYIATADFNRDGAIDLAVSNYDGGTVSVLLRDEKNNTFRPHTLHSVGKFPSMLVAHDLDGDGISDIVVGNLGSDSLSILYGVGDGGFEPAMEVPLPANTGPSAVAVGDINRDGMNDIVIAGSGGNAVYYCTNQFNRSWALSDPITCASHPRWVALGDFDKDGTTDLAVACRDSNSVTVLMSTSENLFSIRKDYTVGSYPRCVEKYDITRDGYDDLLVSNPGDGTYSVLINDTMGGFVLSGTVKSSGYPMKLAMMDCNGDGYLDLMGLLYGDLRSDSGEITQGPIGIVELLYGNDKFEFIPIKNIELSWGAVDFLVADMNKDARPDLVFTLSVQNRLGVLYGNDTGFAKAPTRLSTNEAVSILVATDLDGDATTKELILVPALQPYFSVIKIDSNLNRVELGRGSVTQPISNIATGTIDAGNTSTDIVLCEQNSWLITVFLNRGNGTFQRKGSFSVRDPSASRSAYPSSIAIGDVNNDTFADVVTGNPTADSVSVLLGDGTGNFGVARETVVGNYPLGVNLADVNHDGNLDLLFVSTRDPNASGDNAQPRLVCWLGNGDGTFDSQTQARYATSDDPRGLLLADLDNDNDLDAVTIHPSSKVLTVFGSKPNGAFVQSATLKVWASPQSAFAVDINRDNLLDLLTINSNGTFSVFINQGKLSFSQDYFYYAGYNPIGGVLGDFNRDGKWDVLMVNKGSNDMTLVLGE